MAKRKQEPTTSFDDDSALMSSLMEVAATDIARASGADNRMMPEIGLRFPSLSLRYLFCMSALPFCRFYEIYGPQRSAKTSFLCEVYRWVLLSGGTYSHICVEDKDAPQLREAIIRKDFPGHVTALKSFRAGTMNEYMRMTYAHLKAYKAKMAEKFGSKRHIPFVIGIDSLTAKLAEETLTTFEDNGGVSMQRFAFEAKILNDWFRVVPNYINKWPAIVIGINHDQQKPGSRPGMPTVHHTPGGFGQGYAASAQILMTGSGDLKRTAAGVGGQEIEFKITKGSLAPTGNKITAELKWQTVVEEVDGVQKQVMKSWWDWDKATVVMLESIIDNKLSGERGRNLQDLLGLYKKTGGRYSCKAAGVTADSPLFPSELGAVIESNAELCSQLEKILEIRTDIEFKRGDDMAAIIDDYYEQFAPRS